MTRARIQILLRHAFWASLILRLPVYEDKNIPTACTDGTCIRYNPDFIEGLQKGDYIQTIVAHEIAHCMLYHHTRRNGRNPFLWNIAADYAVNYILKAARFNLPKGVFYDENLGPLSVEKIYEKLRKDVENLKAKYGDNPDPGGCGAVQDHKTSNGKTASNKEEESKWKSHVARAAMEARMKGDIPAGLGRFVEELLNPSVAWQYILQDFVERSSESDYSFLRPNKRHIVHGIYLPSLMPQDELPEVLIFIDTSGSIGAKELNRFASEVVAILRVFDTVVTIVYCDTEISNVEQFSSHDKDFKLHPKGGGGTSFVPPFKWLSQQATVYPSCIIYLTDLMGDFPPPSLEPSCPVLWCGIGNWEPYQPIPFGQLLRIKEL